MIHTRFWKETIQSELFQETTIVEEETTVSTFKKELPAEVWTVLTDQIRGVEASREWS